MRNLMIRTRTILSLALVTVLIVTGAVWSAYDVMDTNDSTVSEINTVLVQDKLLTVKLVDIPLEKVLKTIAEQAGFRLIIEGELQDQVTLSFSDIPLVKGIRHLMGNTPVIFCRSEKMLTKLYVFAGFQRQEGEITESLLEELPVTEIGHTGSLTLLQQLNRGNVKADELVNLIAYHEDPAVRRLAVINLARKPASESLRGFSIGLVDEDPVVRLRSVVGLGRIHGDAAVALLSQALLTNSCPVVRRMAAKQLAKSGHPLAKDTLYQAQWDTNDRVRKIVEAAIARFEKH